MLYTNTVDKKILNISLELNDFHGLLSWEALKILHFKVYLFLNKQPPPFNSMYNSNAAKHHKNCLIVDS